MGKKGIDDAMRDGDDINWENKMDLNGPEFKEARKREASKLAQRTTMDIEKAHKFLVFNETFHILIRNDFGGGYYRAIEDRAVSKLIEQYSQESYSIRLNREVTNLLMNHHYASMDSFDEDKENLNLLNGVFSIKYRKIRPFHPSDKFTHIIPVQYDPEAKCPIWERVLSEIFPHGCEDNIKLLQQIGGYCLQTERNHEKFFIFQGSGANGKSVVAYVFQYILGFENCTCLGLDKIANPSFWHILLGKMLNITTENDARVQNWSEAIKTAVSGEPLLANPKYKPQFKFIPFAKHIIAMNDMPYLEDKSSGVSRRMVIVPFKRTFSESEQDIELKHKLAREASGILNWFLAGLDSYLKEGFNIPEANIEIANEIKTESNSVLMFFKERYIISFSDDDFVKCEDFYEEYKDWCAKNGYKFYSSNKVGKILALDRDVKSKMKRVGAEVFKAYFQLQKV